MKTNTALTAFLVFAAPSLLLAGEAESTNTTMPPQPMAAYSDGGWFVGGGADYLLDAEEIFYNAHLGYDFGNGSSLFVEAGWIGADQSGFPFNTSVDIIPITLDYKYEIVFTESFGLYLGLGVGGANVDVSAGFASGGEWVLAAQAFVGLVYEFSPTFEIYGGVRYLWFDDVNLAGANIDDFDDYSFGAGIRFNF